MADLARTLEADARFWNKSASKYAVSPVADMAGYEKSLDRAASFLTPGAQVLEIGCGTGTTALRLAPFAGHITATDISQEMTAIARQKAAAKGITNVEFIAAPAGDSRFGGSTYDVAMAFNILHLVPDVDAALAQLSAGLKPGGLLITKTACLADMNPLIRYAIPLMRLVGKAPATVLVFSAKDLRAAIERAGFEILADERHASKGKDFRPFIVGRKR